MPQEQHSSLQIVHDARSGFHDIKAPPRFFPDWLPERWPYVAIAVVCLILLWRYWPKKRLVTAQVSPIPPYRTALASVGELRSKLRQNEIPLRNFGAELSLIMRNFLQNALSFPAPKRSSRELSKKLEIVLQEKIAGISAETRSQVASRMVAILWQCERWTYGDDTDQSDALLLGKGEDLLQQTENVLKELWQLVEREEARTRSVVDHSVVGGQRSEGDRRAL